jgi:hypothetical protein
VSRVLLLRCVLKTAFVVCRATIRFTATHRA